MFSFIYDLFIDYYDKGGLIFLVLLILSITSLTIITLKISQFFIFNSKKLILFQKNLNPTQVSKISKALQKIMTR